MAGVVIRCGGYDLRPTGDRACGADQRGGLLDVPALGNERATEAELLATPGLLHQRCGALATGTGQQVVTEFVENTFRHCQTPCPWPQFQTSVIRPSTTRKISKLPISILEPSLAVIVD